MTTTTKPVVGIVGTSIADGIGATGNESWPVIACKSAGMGHINLGRGGESATILTGSTHHQVRYALLQSCTDVIVEHLVNDFSSSAQTSTAFAAVSVRIRALHSQLAAIVGAQNGGALRIWQATPPPSYNHSTDSWLTTTNQTVNTNEVERVKLAAWVRAGCPEIGGVPVLAGTGGAIASPYLAGVFNVGSTVETAQDSGIWRADGTTGGKYTADGVHPTAIGHAAMAAALNLTTIQTAFDAAAIITPPPPPIVPGRKRLAKVTTGGTTRVVDLLGNQLFDPRTYDYNRTGPRLNPAVLNTSNSSLSRYAIGTSTAHSLIGQDVQSPISYVDESIGTNAGFLQADVPITDSVLEVGLKVSSTNSPYKTIVSFCQFKPTFERQQLLVVSTGAINNLAGSISNTDIQAAEDGVTGFGGPFSNPQYVSTMDRCRVQAQHAYPYADGYPWDGTTSFPLGAGVAGLAATTGALLSDSQQLAGSTLFVPGESVTPGTLRTAKVSATAGNWLLQCIAGGTAGTGTTGVPTGGVPNSSAPVRLKDLPANDTSQPFALTGGTATWVVVGIPIHSDGLQWSQGGNSTIRRTKITGASNDALLIQAAQAGSDGANVPTKLITVENCLIGTGQTDPTVVHDIQCSGVGSITGYGTSGGAVGTGAYTWVSGGTWTANSQAWKSRPWFITVRNCWFSDLASGGEPSFVQAIATASRSNDHAIFVSSEAVRDAGIAAQYGISVSAVQAMKLPGYDWTTTRTVIQSVLNARLALFNAALTIASTDGGAHQSKVDARSWIVWDHNKTATTGTLLHPSMWAGFSGFDVNGYYTGG